MADIRAALLIIACMSWPVSPRVLPETSVNETNAVLAASNLFPTLPIVVLNSTNDKCRSDSQLLLDNLRNFTTWATQMLDASAKSVQGVYVGSIFQFGNFEECVYTEIPIQAQYCLATLTLKPPASQPINKDADIYRPLGSVWDKIGHEGDVARVPRHLAHYGLCIPASCSHSDLEASIRRHLASTPHNHTFSVEVQSQYCQTNRKEEPLSGGSIAYCIVMGFIFLLVMLCTFCDNNTYFLEEKSEQLDTKLQRANSCGYPQCFSLKKNLFALSKPPNSSLGSMYGLKFLSACGVITAHRLLLSRGGPLQNYEAIEKSSLFFPIGVILQYEAVVDSFFLLSGILLPFVMLRTLEKKKVNPIQLIILRYIRLTPVYAVVIFFGATVEYHLGEGPLWNAVMARERQFCVKNWWTNLLFVNNYVNDDEMCLLHSWYMAPELHFYVISIFLMLLIHKHPKSGYVVLGIATVVSLIIPFSITYFNHIDPIQFFYAEEFKNDRTEAYFSQMYTKSHVHGTPYLVGVITGLILHRLRSRDIKWTWQSNLGLVTGMFISFCSLVPGAFMNDTTWKYSDTVAALEQPQRRLLFPLGIALILTSLTFNKTSIASKFLSSQMMFFLSKLTYSAYLASFCLQLMTAASLTVPLLGSVTSQIRDSLSDICVSFAVALVLYLFIEAPTENLISKVFKKQSNKRSSVS